MEAEQLTLPFRLIRRKNIKDRRDNSDLIGRSFMDRSNKITVMSVCPSNPEQVMVERDMEDGKRWSVSVGLIRLIVGRRRERRAA